MNFKLAIQKQRPNQEINKAPGTILSRFANEYSRVLVVIISFQTQWRIILIHRCRNECYLQLMPFVTRIEIEPSRGQHRSHH